MLDVFFIGPLPMMPAPTLQKIFISADDSDGRRLGNMLFCYASMLGIANYNNMTPVISKSSRLVDIFDVKIALTPDLSNTLGVYRAHEEYGRRGSAYDYTTRNLARVNTKLLGYYQSWKYLEGAESIVRDNLVFRDKYLKPAVQFLAAHPLPSAEFIRVGIHIRRGDMIQEYYRNYGYVVPDAEYFRRAMQYYHQKYAYIQFVVCSDDIQWAELNIEGENVVFSKGNSDVVDLAILTLCNHTIVSVGSFGWWAAYFAHGDTVYYKDWPKEYSRLEYHVDKLAYFPPHWVPL
jgi:galactoside 2-L-fucosyltransferase 1/2